MGKSWTVPEFLLGANWAALTDPVWSKDQAQRIDRDTIQNDRSQQLKLMEAAGKAVASSVARRISLGHDILCVAGPGNNGGDAIVAAHHLAKLGYGVTLLSVGRIDPSMDSYAHSSLLNPMKIRSLEAATDSNWPQSLTRQTVLVDGLTGLGFSGKWRDGLLYEVFKVLKAFRFAAICSIDLPAGMAADQTDDLALNCLSATWSVTFGVKKPCHVATPTLAFCGQVETAAIDFHPDVISAVLASSKSPIAKLRADNALLWQLCQPKRTAHKYDRGHILVLQGEPNYLGASVQTAIAAFECGAGWVTLGQTALHTEPQTIPMELTKASLTLNDGQINDDTIEFCIKRQVKTLVVGPGRTRGLNRSSWETLHTWQRQHRTFLIIDAGALLGFWTAVSGLQFIPEKTLLTPHLGEWQKMQAGLEKPFHAFYSHAGLTDAMSQASKLGVSVIVKDACPLIFDPTQETLAKALPSQIYIADYAGPALAQAGSGDRLAGLAAAVSLSGIPAAKVAALAYALLWSSR